MDYPDETDMTLDDLKARLAQAEPVEIVDAPVTVNDSPWLQRVSTRAAGRVRIERWRDTLSSFRLTGPAPS
jgi:hypothetical protein